MISKFFLYVSIISLGIIALLTVLACAIFGLKTGLLIGLFLVLFLGGIESLWEILTHSINQDIQARKKIKEKESFNKATENNPTLR